MKGERGNRDAYAPRKERAREAINGGAAQVGRRGPSGEVIDFRENFCRLRSRTASEKARRFLLSGRLCFGAEQRRIPRTTVLAENARASPELAFATLAEID